ncbi:L-threonylcarbamoyladenylate synthase [Sphingosinicella soli]|uniref:Threonylcarbamoyl-AMP synthase n=1 Tax=Sphingosinicella soli TaxID=333708 RepID=A0A7W7B3A4_9SPHN|nr:L-threonylcarbamoyladenylate synthase [Sphingosinicella soli]MBB4633237.1 L-threonylcarbamoyladenylate synthase [Sphingosinicella soli]
MSTETLAPDAPGLARAAALLRAGEVVAIPTETVYGLAADATNADAVARIYAAKGRPSFNPLIAHVSGAEMAAAHVDLSPLARALMRAFWPGPLTLVLPRRAESTIAAIVTAGLPTLAIRCPDHPVPQALIAALGRPLAAPSANASGQISATRAGHVLKTLGGRIPLVIEGGPCTGGIESTIVAVKGDRLRLLRPGGIPREVLEAFAPIDAAGDSVEAPGMMASHYAPSKPLRLEAQSAHPGEFLIGYGAVAGEISLSPSGDPAEAAARLFDCLHAADTSSCTAIAVAPVPPEGLGAAINDRLRRAAAPR